MKQTENKGACSCGGCGEVFRRLSGFDKHRAGPWADRRCLSPTPMAEQGFTRDTKGRWMAPPDSRGNRRVFGKVT